MVVDERFMRRALQLASLSPYMTHPNPMVGAVIVYHDRIIGEGWHRRCGDAHAEVNAIRSVKDDDLKYLKDSTMYVTLEPCSHYGKTPPCAELIIERGIRRVVVGATDPFEKVSGRGIAMLRDAGIEVVEGVLAEESRLLNRRFFTAHILRRPYIILKWAKSVDGYMDAVRDESNLAYRFSNHLSTLQTHRRRALVDAVVTTSSTVEADSPRLNVRSFAGPNPRRIIVDLHVEPSRLMKRLYADGVTSVLVEAGPRWLQSMIDAKLWDEAFVETSSVILGERGAHPAPELLLSPEVIVESEGQIVRYIRNSLS